MNKIDSTVRIIGDVEIGDNNEILPYTVLIGPLAIGNRNYIGPHVTVGTPGQDTKNPNYNSSDARIEIGSDNFIREYTAIQKPCYREITLIGDGCYLMQSVHIPHDAVVEDDVVITPMVVLGGLSRIMKGANLGISSSVHQYGVIGAYSIVAMGAPAVKNVRPFSRYVPGKPISVNTYALNKFGFERFSKEIEQYVLRRIAPQSKEIAEIVESYERAALESGRPEY
jgi:UDP-N-acetylglucosamine acyltransferase